MLDGFHPPYGHTYITRSDAPPQNFSNDAIGTPTAKNDFGEIAKMKWNSAMPPREESVTAVVSYSTTATDQKP